jgi:hypothetical protein
MRKHKINSILFAFPDDELSDLFLKKFDFYNHFQNNFDFTVQYVSNNKTRIDNFITHRQVVISFNMDFGFLISKERFKEVALVTAKSNEDYLMYFEKVNLIGFQRHLLSRNILTGVDINSKENLSLGYIRSNENLVEPIFRKSDIISFDLSSIKLGENINIKGALPTGFTAEEFIQLNKFAGYSDNVKLVNFSFQLTDNNSEPLAELLAASMWYFLESLSISFEEEDYEENLVHFDETDDYFNFQKSLSTQKCWVHFEGKEVKFACTNEEYNLAVQNGVVSERLVKLLFES